MKQRFIHIRLLAWCFCMLGFLQFTPAQNPACGFQWMLQKQASSDSPVIQRIAAINQILEEAGNETIIVRADIIIPVVVHVVWHSPEENVSDEAILSQIEILNRDFNGENEDLAEVPDEFRPFIARKGIRFCLAAEDPQGLPASGIVRVQTNVESIGTKEDLSYSALGGSNAWDSERFLNIWVANTGGFVTGFGTFPEQVDAGRQGVVIHPKYFGNNNSHRYNQGRVAVHEVGHYLGLQHVWGSDERCETDDGVEDTPVQQRNYTGCPGYPQISCGSADMFMNFMDYVDDGCMVMFTQGQMKRMLATIEIFRPALANQGNRCVKNSVTKLNAAFRIYPNPAIDEINIDFPDKEVAETGRMEIYNALGQMVFQTNTVLRNHMNIELPVLAAGIYWIRIGKQSRRLIIQ
jgi:Pregnancy-associated plasma protein-A/Secretion system C-terminal sorting domain